MIFVHQIYISINATTSAIPSPKRHLFSGSKNKYLFWFCLETRKLKREAAISDKQKQDKKSKQNFSLAYLLLPQTDSSVKLN